MSGLASYVTKALIAAEEKKRAWYPLFVYALNLQEFLNIVFPLYNYDNKKNCANSVIFV